MIIGPRAVDYTIGLVRDPSIWPIVRLVTCAMRGSRRPSTAACKGCGPLVYIFVELGALQMSHTTSVGGYEDGLLGLVLPSRVRRSGSIFRCL